MQHIDVLEAQDSYKNIKKGFKWEKIPKFAVITGENGSGKSSLLEGIMKKKFTINNHQGLQASVGLYNQFKLQDINYNSDFTAKLMRQEIKLMDLYLKATDFNNPRNVFMLTKNIVSQWGENYSQEIEKITFQQFITRDFSHFSESIRNYLSQRRDDLNLPIYSEHFKRNGMNEDKFYLSTHEEIKQWFSQLQDKNFESINTIFDESALNAIFGEYLIKKTNIRDDLDDLEENLSSKEIKQRIEEEIGKNPLDEINRLLKQVYSKYSLVSELRKDNCQPRIVCKTQDGVTVSLKELSTGEQIIISLYMWRYDKTPLHSMVLLFDEPDAHLNPKMAKMLIDVLKNTIVKKFSCQVIMTTHSLSTVAYCEEKDLFYMEEGRVSKISKEECIQNLADGVMTFEKALNQLKLIENSNKPILVVEGKTEEIIFEKYYEFKKQEMPFIVIDGKGADNLPQFCTCFNILNLSQKRVFLFDYDEKGIENFKKIKTNKNIAKLYVKSEQEMSEYQKQAKTFTIEKIFPFSIVQKYYEMGKELVKIFLADFIDGLSKQQEEQYSDFFKEQDSDECLYKIVDSKDVEKRKTDFASRVIEICKEDDLQELEKLMQRIEAEFLKK